MPTIQSGFTLSFIHTPCPQQKPLPLCLSSMLQQTPNKSHFPQSLSLSLSLSHCIVALYLYYFWQTMFLGISRDLQTILDMRKVTPSIKFYEDIKQVLRQTQRRVKSMHTTEEENLLMISVLNLVIYFVFYFSYCCILLLNVALCIYDEFSIISSIFSYHLCLLSYF